MWPYPKLIAHRGAGLLAPENTLAALREGARLGYRMAEYDVKLTADQVPILLHDDTLERTSTGSGRASQFSLKQLSNLDFGAWHSPPFAGEPIATLSSIAAYTLANGIFSSIEIKPEPELEAATGRKVAEAAARLWKNADAPPLLSSFSVLALEAARQAAPHLPRMLLIDGPVPKDWKLRLQALGCAGMDIDLPQVNATLISAVHANGYRIRAWTVNEPAQARQFLLWGCDAVFTDAIDRIAPGD